MTDDIIDQLAWFVTNEVRMPAGLIVTVIDEIERLRADNDELRGDLLMKVHRIGELAAEIGRLLAELALLRRQLAAVTAERDLWQRESHT